MNKEIQFKNIILYSIIIIIILIVVELCFKPEIYITGTFNKLLQKVTLKQSIAPERLFINVWRITKNSYVDENLNNQDWLRWRVRYVKHIKTMEDANLAINTMLASLNDPYTKFLQSDLFSKQKVVLDSKITGVGILFNQAGDEVVINHILDNSSASNENIMAGDTIVSVNGKNAKDIGVTGITSVIETSKSENVEITIKRDNVLITKKLKKQDIPIQTMDYKISNDNIGIITLSNIMGENAVKNFRNIINKTNNTKGLIIDLRNNYGGILQNAIEMLNIMMGEKKVVSIKSRINTEYQIYTEDDKVFIEKPVIILINKNTASAAEIFAGALRDNNNAILIGENSFGKNSIQQVIPMPNYTGLILTTDKYILPNGEDIYGIGLEPDIMIKQDTIATYKNDKQLHFAKKLLNELVENNKKML